jgi:hypothetical protein
MQDLETGQRHNSRSRVTATAATAGVSPQDIEDLSSMLAKLGRSLSRDAHGCVQMIEAEDLIDMELEREVFDPPTTEIDTSEQDQENDDDDGHMGVLESEENAISIWEGGDVDEKDPPPLLTLSQAKDVSEKLFAFVSENCALVKQAGTRMHADYVDMADTIRFAIQRMSKSTNTRQASISEFFSNTVSS